MLLHNGNKLSFHYTGNIDIFTENNFKSKKKYALHKIARIRKAPGHIKDRKI